MSTFHNTQPRTREERLTAQNKEVLEKGRLKRDVAGFIKEQKQRTMDKQQHIHERKRQEAIVRKSVRWEQMQAARQAEAERLQAVRDAGLKCKTNKSSEHYNIISLEYHQSKEGQQLRHKDEFTRYRAVLRSQNLFNKTHSVSHNIITGAPRQNTVALPPAPQ